MNAVDPVLAALSSERERGRVADAYLFLGRSRTRLREVGEAAATLFLDCRGPLAQHPDYACFDPQALGTSGLKVEHIASRKEGVPCVEMALRYRPVAGSCRVVLLVDADRMLADAQGALLKTAEEPPPGTLLILLARDHAALLPALRSRCRTYRVLAPARAELQRRALAAGLEEGAFEGLSAAFGGGEEALEAPPELRRELLETAERFHEWLAGRGRIRDWLSVPEAGNLSTQRELATQRLAACLGWLARTYPDLAPERARRADQAVARITAALADLQRQVSPGILFEALGEDLETIP